MGFFGSATRRPTQAEMQAAVSGLLGAPQSAPHQAGLLNYFANMPKGELLRPVANSYKPTLGEKAEGALAKGLGKVMPKSVANDTAHGLIEAGRLFSPVDPIGRDESRRAEHAAMQRGSYLSALGNGLMADLAMIPVASKAREGLEVWHGSPYLFDKFSLNHVGTGEGAQAIGHGLYFADSKRLAQAYRKPDMTRHYTDPGYLYQVHLGVNPNELMNFDSSFAQQPENVKAAFASLGIQPADGPNGAYWFRDAKNQMAQRDDSWQLAANGANLTPQLRDNGVPGVFRGSPGHREFSIFDQNLIDILARHR